MARHRISPKCRREQSATRPWHTTKYIVVYCRTFFAPGVYVGLEASDNFTFGELMHRVFRVLQYSQLEENGPDPRTAHAIIPPRTAKMARTTLFDWSFALFAYMGVAPPSIAGDSSLRAHSALSPNVLPNRARTLCACAPTYPVPLLRTQRSKASLDRSVYADLSELAGAAAGVYCNLSDHCDARGTCQTTGWVCRAKPSTELLGAAYDTILCMHRSTGDARLLR